MPTISAIFEREFLELTRAALKLERLTVCSPSIPSAVQYRQIMKQLSELYSRWSEHRVRQRERISRFLPNDRESAVMIQDWDAPSFNVELQLKAVSVSHWPRFIEAGLSSIRIAVSEILQLVYQQIASERATCATLIHSRKPQERESTSAVGAVCDRAPRVTYVRGRRPRLQIARHTMPI
jgi:hypothetical protein